MTFHDTSQKDTRSAKMSIGQSAVERARRRTKTWGPDAQESDAGTGERKLHFGAHTAMNTVVKMLLSTRTMACEQTLRAGTASLEKK
jgi:hypothetical protein